MSRSAEDVFNDALDRTGEERRRFLADACSGDPTLLGEVESLLEAYEAGDESLLPARPPAMPERIGAYPIRAEAARGGMGVVYLAEDEGLHRRVALKVLPAWLAREPAWLERFRREGRTLAGLDHANIATVYSLEEAGGVHFLTMEWVEGETLAERIHGRPFPTREAIAICLQIARALQAAHARGVVHRDLKPLNVMVRPDGKVKVLDFGLAKALGEAGVQAAPGGCASAGESLLAGTPGYMAPEQVQGHSVDHRADIWAFGCMLFEVFTGKPALPAIGREDPASSGTLVPNLEMLRGVAPPAVIALAARALEPDRERRLGDMDEACRVLESELTAVRRHWLRHPIVVALAGIAVLFALILIRRFWFPPQPAPTTLGALARAGQVQLTYTGTARSPEISADGSELAWIDGNDAPTLWVRALPDGLPRELQRFWTVTGLRWSPDGRSLLVAGQRVGAQSMGIVRLAAADGAVLADYDFDFRIAWAPDGTRFASIEENGHARITDVAAGTAQPLLGTPPWDKASDLDWSPDGRFLVVRGDAGSGEHLWMVGLDDRRATPIRCEHTAWSPRWTEGGTALFLLDPKDGLVRMRVDAATGLSRGEPEQVLPLSGLGGYTLSASADGNRVVYARGPSHANIWVHDLATGVTTRLSHGTFEHGRTRFSPDGGSIIFTRGQGEEDSDVFVLPITGGEPKRLTSLERCTYAVWSPDGRQIAFTRREHSRVHIGVMGADGTGVRTFEVETSGTIAWRPGDAIAFSSPGNHRIQELDVTTGAVREVYNAGADFYVWQPQWAPDGRRLAVLETPLRGSDGPRVVVVDPEAGTSSVAHVGLATPVSWSSDGLCLNLVARRTGCGGEAAAGDVANPAFANAAMSPTLALLRVPVSGGAADTLAILAHAAGLWSSIDVTPDGRRAVYSAADFLSDIWMVEASVK